MSEHEGFPRAAADLATRRSLLKAAGGGFLLVTAALGNLTDPSQVPLPPYYPRTPAMLKDCNGVACTWARTRANARQ